MDRQRAIAGKQQKRNRQRAHAIARYVGKSIRRGHQGLPFRDIVVEHRLSGEGKPVEIDPRADEIFDHDLQGRLGIAAFECGSNRVAYARNHFVEQVLVLWNIQKPAVNRRFGKNKRPHQIGILESGEERTQSAVRMPDQMRAVNAQVTKQTRQVMRIRKRRMIGQNRTVYVRIVIAAAIEDNAVIFREPVELRQPLPVILQAPVNKNDRGPAAGDTVTLFDVVKFDVNAVTVLQDAAL
jgi:hypothetical protein